MGQHLEGGEEAYGRGSISLEVIQVLLEEAWERLQTSALGELRACSSSHISKLGVV